MQSYIFGGNTGLSYDQIERQRDVANELLRANMNTPRDVGEGLSAIGRALAAKAIEKRTARADEANRAAYQQTRDGIFSSLSGGLGGGSTYSPTPAQSVADDTMAALGKTPMNPYREAIASIESAGSGGYAAVGPTHPKLGRALGRYQIMEANIGPWSQEVLGRAVSPEEFMANPQLQDAIFDGKFGKYVEQFGPEGAAQAWFAGPGGVGKLDRKDVLGTTVGEYGQKFTRAIGGAQVQPAQAKPGQSVNPAILMQLAEIQGNPYASESDKAIAGLLMQQATQAMDPLRQMEIERAQLELEQMRQPKAPELPAEVRELQWRAAEAGLVPGTPEYQEFIRAGGSGPLVSVNTGSQPQPELLGTQGLVAIPDPSVPEGFRVVPAPGSPIAEERRAEEEAKARAAQAAATNEQTRSSVVLEATQEIRKALEGGGMFDLPEVGIVGNAIRGVNQEAADVGGMLETLKGMVVFDRLEKLKQASATGASGLGQVTEREIALLGAQLGALEQNLSKDRILSTLSTVEDVFGKLSPQAQAYLTGAADALPEAQSGNAAPQATIDFSAMSLDELNNVDVNSLTPEQMDAMLRRYNEVDK